MLRLGCGRRQPLLTRAYHTKQCFGHRRKPFQTTHGLPSSESLQRRAAEPNLWRLATAYQNHGHSVATLDPLGLATPILPPSLSPETYGLNPFHEINTQDILFAFPASTGTVAEAVDYLRDMYSGTLSLDPGAITDETEREWLVRHYENCRHSPLTPAQQRRITELLLESQAFDVFLSKKFGTVKRYGAEGAESMMVFFDWLFEGAGLRGVRDMIVCMPHRGRLNLLTGLLRLPSEALFHKMQGKAEFVEGAPSTGDVISHLGASIELPGPLYVSLLQNPSHLEAVNPVAMGKSRARELSLRSGGYSPSPDNQLSQVLGVQVHGDASFSAQGVVLECFSLSGHPHFDVGGCVHLIVNNQLGFTTEAEYGRSSHHTSDVGRVVGTPVLHVNGDHPEEVARAASIALDYQRQFERDIIVNMICFRRWGHNELDNPSLTQPSMYRVIDCRSSVPDNYSSLMESCGVLSPGESEQLKTQYKEHLEQSLLKSRSYKQEQTHLCGRHWCEVVSASPSLTQWDTGSDLSLLKFIGAKSVHTPADIAVHPRLMQSHVMERVRRVSEGRGLDWATAEALAIGTLLYQGFNVRLSGQDVGRGTFSHRHAMLVCQDSDAAHIPLNHITPNQTAFLEVANSPLSEEAVLGFEYGFSMENPAHLVIWEAQFGDFFNGAQMIIDTFVASGESKWLLQSGLVMLLPHGYDGAGPDHSSCHVERFLQLCDSREGGPDGDCVNMHVSHPTTPAQYYHLLRRQMVRNFRKPLIVQSPKTLLRLPAAVSRLEEMGPGTIFHPVLSDHHVNPQDVKRVVFCSGKHYYTLDKHRTEKRIADTAIVRLELICPFPAGLVSQQLNNFPNAKEFVWSQEEPENMGPWAFINPRFRKQLGVELRLVSREACAATAVGVADVHKEESAKLLAETFPI